MNKPPPPKETCLQMAKHYFGLGKHTEDLAWRWLFAWGFYDQFLEDWYE